MRLRLAALTALLLLMLCLLPCVAALLLSAQW